MEFSSEGDVGLSRRERIFEDLRGVERGVCLPALREAIRLLSSACFEQLTVRHIQDVANYRSIEIGEEVFFEKAFSPGKEAAGSLTIARQLGRDEVLGDLLRLERAATGLAAGDR